MGERVRVVLVCGECGSRNYQTSRSKTARNPKTEQSSPDKKLRLEIKKHCPHCNKHTVHKESK